MGSFRLRKPGGGSALRGGDGFRGAEPRIFEFAASGGVVLGGSATVSFIRGKPAVDHGGGNYFPMRTPGLPIRRRKRENEVDEFLELTEDEEILLLLADDDDEAILLFLA